MKRICKYCHKEFEGINPKVFSNHVRWCDYNKDYDHEKFLKLMKDRKKIDDDKKYGKIITLTKNCVICSKSFSYEVREKNVNPKNHKKCCSQKCSSKIGSKVFLDKLRNDENFKNKISMNAKKLWENPNYAERVIKNGANRNKQFSSKGEREIIKYFKEKYPDDEWTFGGCLRYNGLRLSRDLYSNKLKVCIEYDGIWHFKDIHGQLKDKQNKDKALKNWCSDNNYSLIRIDEDLYNSNKEYYKSKLDDLIYENLICNDNHDIILLGNKY